MKHCKVLLCGIGGYGITYVNALLDDTSGLYDFVGCVDPYPEKCTRYAEIVARGIPVYGTLEEFYKEQDAELCVICTPIHLHVPMMVYAMEHGSHVLCEKPLCGDERQIDALIVVRERTGRNVSIGFQWAHAAEMLDCKKDILRGIYGAPVLLKTIVLWPRNTEYYTRGIGWAGKMRAKDGSLIRDSVANNATAHYLFNPYFLLGETIDRARMPDSLESHTWRANPIETFDTAIIRGKFVTGGEVVYVGSHAVDRVRGPHFVYRFENGTITYRNDGHLYAELTAGTYADGKTTHDYGDPFSDDTRKLRIAAENVVNGTHDTPCSIEAAAVQTKIIAAVHEQNPEAAVYPPERVYVGKYNDKPAVICRGLYEELNAFYDAL